MQDFEVESYKEKKEEIDKKKEALALLIKEMESFSDEKLRNVRKQDLLSEVPCGNKYPTCRFIKDAHEAGDLIKITERRMSQNAIETNILDNRFTNLTLHKWRVI